MSNSIEIFNNVEFGDIKVFMENGKPYFSATEIAKALGYTNPHKAVKDHCKNSIIRRGNDSLGRQQDIKYISESDVYRLIIRSKLPSAEKFEHWVFDEVLPSIRKHGMYAVDELLNNPDLAIKIFTDLKEEREKNRQLKEQNALLITQNAELKPKASYYDIVLQCKDLIPITVIAKDYGWSARKMNEFLSGQKVQFKNGDIWLLYQKYAEMGYTSTKTNTYTDKDDITHSKIHTYWTQKGRLFIYELMKKNGTLPLIERDM